MQQQFEYRLSALLFGNFCAYLDLISASIAIALHAICAAIEAVWDAFESIWINAWTYMPTRTRTRTRAHIAQ